MRKDEIAQDVADLTVGPKNALQDEVSEVERRMDDYACLLFDGADPGRAAEQTLPGWHDREGSVEIAANLTRVYQAWEAVTRATRNPYSPADDSRRWMLAEAILARIGEPILLEELRYVGGRVVGWASHAVADAVADVANANPTYEPVRTTVGGKVAYLLRHVTDDPAGRPDSWNGRTIKREGTSRG